MFFYFGGNFIALDWPLLGRATTRWQHRLAASLGLSKEEVEVSLAHNPDVGIEQQVWLSWLSSDFSFFEGLSINIYMSEAEL